MSRNLILIITIFGFWLYIYLTNIAEEQKKSMAEKYDIDDFANDDVKFTSAVSGENLPTKNGIPDLTQMRGRRYITSPVKAKGE